MPNLTKVRARLNNIKKKLHTNADTLQLLKNNKLLVEITKDWWSPPSLTSNFAIASEYFELFVADKTGELDQYLKSATSAVIEGETYTIKKKTHPRGKTKQWSMRLELTGEKQ